MTDSRTARFLLQESPAILGCPFHTAARPLRPIRVSRRLRGLTFESAQCPDRYHHHGHGKLVLGPQGGLQNRSSGLEARLPLQQRWHHNGPYRRKRRIALAPRTKWTASLEYGPSHLKYVWTGPLEGGWTGGCFGWMVRQIGESIFTATVSLYQACAIPFVSVLQVLTNCNIGFCNEAGLSGEMEAWVAKLGSRFARRWCLYTSRAP